MRRQRPTPKQRLLAPVSHWTFLAKFFLCDGIRRAVISRDDAKRAHKLSDEELNRWITLFNMGDGLEALRRVNSTNKRGKRAA